MSVNFLIQLKNQTQCFSLLTQQYALSFGLSAANVLAVVVLGLAGAVAAAALFRPNDQLIEKMSLFNDNDYSKYDFSEFDN